jgi:hypothetical protein
MKTINQFLKSHLDNFKEDDLNLEGKRKEIENINSLFLKGVKSAQNNRHLRVNPVVQKGQIWTVKNQYDDFLGVIQKTSHPFIVLVNNTPHALQNEDLVRVFIVSPFVEMGTNNDEICYDASIIGFPFLVELWNDQPVLTEILDEYIGFYEIKSSTYFADELTKLPNDSMDDDITISSQSIKEIKEEFKNLEISRAKYINQSVRSLMSFLDNKQSDDAGVVISLFNIPEYPQFYIGQNAIESTYSLAAKSGVEKEDRYLLFENKNIPFKIYIRKNENGFVLTVDAIVKMQLFKSTNEEFVGLSNSERTVFSELTSGTYILHVNSIEQLIKIRLK